MNEKKRTKVVFAIDASPSIYQYGLTDKVLETINSYVRNLAEASTDEDVYEIAAVKFDSKVAMWRNFGNAKFAARFDRQDYRPQYGDGTAFIDAVDFCLKICSTEAMADPDCAFLVIAITDGEENSSVKCNASSLRSKLEVADQSGKYTVVVNCPPSGVKFAERCGFLPGNIKPWEQTVKGMEELSRSTSAGLQSYTTARSKGHTATRSFYADTTLLSASQVKQGLKEVDGKVLHWVRTARDPEFIRKFCEAKHGRFDAGHVFYELVKSEKVQQQKEIVIWDEANGKYYIGWHAARQILNLPTTGEIRLKPGAQGTLRVFVQSTSFTRKIKDGQRVIHLGG